MKLYNGISALTNSFSVWQKESNFVCLVFSLFNYTILRYFLFCSKESIEVCMITWGQPCWMAEQYNLFPEELNSFSCKNILLFLPSNMAAVTWSYHATYTFILAKSKKLYILCIFLPIPLTFSLLRAMLFISIKLIEAAALWFF
jgi:hypothetical protein